MIPFGGGIRINENLQYSAALHTEFFLPQILRKCAALFSTIWGTKKPNFALQN